MVTNAFSSDKVRQASEHAADTATEGTPLARCVERIVSQAERVFGDPEKAVRWLQKPKRELDGKTPLGFVAGKGDPRQVEEMLVRIEHGMF